MSNAVVRAVSLSKIYRLYSKPHHRFLDMFGLLRRANGKYTEHLALNGVNLEICRGEKVAIIGRNGAGKSTLLKLATNVIEPTSGRIDVAEGVHALLQIGSGFHPEFSGRENARSYLAHLGVTGKKVDDKVREILEFAELEEYIDQPIKTYSTGMVARLMFATSTAIAPKLLVLDEILGVGDAYFTKKSYDRIKELCDAEGTTVLLVSHDVYSAAKLCERMVWIDHGRIMIDGPSPTVMKAYEDSIRTQEETRLRKRKEERLGALRQLDRSPVIVEIRCTANQALPAFVYFRRIAFMARDGSEIDLPLFTDKAIDEHSSHIIRDEGNWGPQSEWAGRQARIMLDHGSPFNKVSGVFVLPTDALPSGDEPIRVRLEYAMERPSSLSIRCFVDGSPVECGELPQSDGGWVSHLASSAGHVPRSPLEFQTAGVHGTRRITVEGLRLLGASGTETFQPIHLAPVTVEIDYRVRDLGLCERAQVLIAFQRDGVNDVCRVIARELEFDGTTRPTGTVRMHFSRLPLANGRYATSVMIAKAGYYEDGSAQFYSINPDVYACIARGLEFQVIGGGAVGSGTGVVLDAQWSIGERDAPLDGDSSAALPLEFPDSVRKSFPSEFPVAWRAVEDALQAVADADLRPLARRSPALAGFNWTSYLRLSVIRMVRAHAALLRLGADGGKVLDVGAYFGNFSLMLARSGYQVVALDSYCEYGHAFDGAVAMLRGAGVNVLDFATAGPSFGALADASYDIVACMGVIEHIPHTPRSLLEAIDRVLRPGGLLVLDTPNLGYAYTRQRLAQGESVFCPIELQYDTEIPFEGHHREYTEQEIRWMLTRIGHQTVHLELFNYSIYGAGTLSGHDLDNFRAMERDPSLREVILAVSRKPE